MLKFVNLQKYKELELPKNNNIEFYFSAFVITVGLFVTLALLVDLLKIHIYRHDSIYYIDGYFDKLKSEGRWLYYLLFPITSKIPGRVAVFFDLLFLFLFFFLVSKRWTGRASYSLLLSLLVIQVAPLMAVLMWPATGIASCLILFLAALISPYINVYLFYILFGVLLFGTGSFYLLPLAHLHLFKNFQIGQNFKILSYKIIPAWALGFIIGYIFSLLLIYTLSGQVGIQIADWRRPNYIRSLPDLVANTISSFSYLQNHIAELFSGFWRKFLMVTALLIGFYGANKKEYIPATILAFGISVAHFVLTIPTGIVISFRTSLAAWIGVLVIFFFYPNIKKWQYFILLPIILLMMLSFYRVNHETLKWYSSITNTYYDELLRITPTRMPPQRYKGLIFLSSSTEVEKMTTFLGSKLHLKRGKMEGLDEDFRWAPVAREAGFKKVILCKTWHKNFAVCKSLYEDYELYQSTNLNHTGLYKIYGQHNGFLIVSLNSDLDLK